MKKSIAKTNIIVFPFILIFAFFVSILESYKYIGFFQKHFYISSYMIYTVSFISFVGLVRSKRLFEEFKRKGLLQIFFGFGTIVFFITILLYVILNEIEVDHYSNFVFTNYHIWPAGLMAPVALLFEVAILFFDMKMRLMTKA